MSLSIASSPSLSAITAALGPNTLLISHQMPVQGVLQHPISRSSFQRYCLREHSEENILFYLDAEKYAQTQSEVERKAFLEQIWSVYISPSAALQINVKASTANDLRRKMDAGDTSPYLFCDLAAEALTSLQTDTYRRFCQSASYYELLDLLLWDLFTQGGNVTLENVLNNPLGVELLRMTCVESSPEDLIALQFFIACTNHVKIVRSPQQVAAEGKYIWSRFLAQDGASVIQDMDAKAWNTVHQDIENNNIGVDVFEPAIQYIKQKQLQGCFEKLLSSVHFDRAQTRFKDFKSKRKALEAQQEQQKEKDHSRSESRSVSRLSAHRPSMIGNGMIMSFVQIMADNEIKSLFLEFCRKECSEENVLFWLAVEDFKLAPESDRPNKAQSLFDKFINAGSEFEIPIDGITKKTIKNGLADAAESLFDHSQNLIYDAIRTDSYKRFVQSPPYTKAIQSRQAAATKAIAEASKPAASSSFLCCFGSAEVAPSS